MYEYFHSALFLYVVYLTVCFLLGLYALFLKRGASMETSYYGLRQSGDGSIAGKVLHCARFRSRAHYRTCSLHCIFLLSCFLFTKKRRGMVMRYEWLSLRVLRSASDSEQLRIVD